MKKLLANPNNERKKRTRKPKTKKIESTSDSKSVGTTTIPTEEKSNPEVKKEISLTPKSKTDDITRDNCINILELLRTPTFSQMMNHLTIKEAIIISLKLGYIDGKYFKTESIAKFLEISEEEVRETTKKILLLYKDNINNFLDRIIEIATDNDNKKRILSIENTNEKH